MSSEPHGPAARFGRILVLVLVLLGLPIAVGGVLVHTATQPKSDKDHQDPAEFLLQVEDVPLTSKDGVSLAAWFIHGRSGMPPIILCHDLGGSRSDLLNSAVILNKAGYPLLLLDFRRHGGSGAAISTLGVNERLDVLAAVAYLEGRKGLDAERIGGWGVGMGAYALALASLESPALRVLALDSIYPDVPTQADRLVREITPPALRALVPALHLIYDPYFRVRLAAYSLRSRLAGLGGKNVLLVAGSETPDRFEEDRLLYQAIPETPEGGKNLLELKRSGLSGLYAEDRTKYDQTILDFFATNLAPGGVPGGAAGPVRVIQK